MARRFAKVSEEEIKTTFFYPSDLVNTKTTIPLRVGEERWIYTSTLRVSVYIHHYSPPLRGIVVYYPVPDTSMALSALSTMAPPAVQRVTKEDEAVMKEWMENYRPVRQRTVRSETTKDKAGALPPAVYSQAK